MTPAICSALFCAGRSVGTSDTKISYGTARLRTATHSATRSDSTWFRKSELAGTPSTSRCARTYLRFFAKDDLPEPKPPEIQIPTPSLGELEAAAIIEN